MEVTATLSCDVAAADLYATVADLGTYPRWLDMVSRAEPAEPAEGDGGPAWSIDIRGQIGPLRRAKRLRMVRTVGEDGRAVRFERHELDGRSHSAWVLDATVDAGPGRTDLLMRLHYGGSLWLPVLDRLLQEEIRRSRPRLVEVVRGGP